MSIPFEGKKRVVIEEIQPQISCGRYPAKTTVNEPLPVSATIFTDSHDKIQAKLQYRPQGRKRWEDAALKPVINDRWEGSFTATDSGMYEFRILAWVDHFGSWQAGFKKKFEDNQDISVEKQIGLNLLEEGLGKLPAPQAKKMQRYLNNLHNAQSPAQFTAIMEEKELDELMFSTHQKNPDVTESEPYRVVVERERARFSAWYEFFPRSTAQDEGRHGTFQDCIQLLPRISRMGFDVLYLPPIHPIGREFRKGKNNSLTAGPEDVGSPWAIGAAEGGHKAIHPELGSLEDFRDLVQEANKQGIEIALDYALQCAPDHPYVKEHPQWFKWRPDGTVQYAENPPKKYQDVLPINFETDDWENLWQELKSIVDYWIEQGVTIFRVDNPHTKSFLFWEWLIGEIHKDRPDIIFLAEAFTRPRVMERLGKLGFTQSYTYFTWRVSQYELTKYMKELTSPPLRYFFRPNFWPNTPDILPPHLTHGGEAAHIVRMVMAATLSSNWGVYGPVYEFGFTEPMPNKEEYVDNEKYELKHWDWNKSTKIGELMTRVNQARKENAALQYTNNLVFSETDNEQLFAYAKVDPKEENYIFVVVNLDFHHKHNGWVKVPLYNLGLPLDLKYEVHDLLTGYSYQWQNEWNYVELAPQNQPAHIFRLSF